MLKIFLNGVFEGCDHNQCGCHNQVLNWTSLILTLMVRLRFNFSHPKLKEDTKLSSKRKPKQEHSSTIPSNINCIYFHNLHKTYLQLPEEQVTAEIKYTTHIQHTLTNTTYVAVRQAALRHCTRPHLSTLL